MGTMAGANSKRVHCIVPRFQSLFRDANSSIPRITLTSVDYWRVNLVPAFGACYYTPLSPPTRPENSSVFFLFSKTFIRKNMLQKFNRRMLTLHHPGAIKYIQVIYMHYGVLTVHPTLHIFWCAIQITTKLAHKKI